MSEIPELLRLADSGNAKDRREAAKMMGNLDYQYDVVMDKLEQLKNDEEKNVRKDADKSFKKLGKKPLMESTASEDGESGTAFDDTVGDSSLEAGEYDLESSMSKRDEDRMERAADGIGLEVMMVEKNTATMDTYGNLIERGSPAGMVKVLNNGARSRITGVDINFANASNISSDDGLEDSMHIGVISPGSEGWKREYSYTDEFTPIKITQNYVDPETGVSPNFLGGDAKSFEMKINITNNLDETIFNVRGTKTLNEAASVESSTADGGEVSASGGSLEFKFDEIAAGETKAVNVNMSASLSEETAAYTAGDLSVTYDVKDKLSSGLDFGAIEGSADIKQGVKRRQRETEPNMYDCEIVFENKSEFIIDMKRFTVFADNADSQSIVLDWIGEDATEDEREIVPSEKVSFEFAYESETMPEFGNFLEFSVQSKVQKKTEITLLIAAHDLKFMAVSITKAYMVDGEEVSEMELDSYRKTEIPTRITVTGVGTFGLEGLSVRDEIPAGFEGPEYVSVARNGRELSADEYSFEKSTDALVINVTDLQNSQEGPFVDDSTLVVDYSAVANNPEPMDEAIESRGFVEGWLNENPESKVRAETDAEEGLRLVVVHRRSLVDISRGIYSTEIDGKDGFEIELDAENAGTATETITVQDLVPTGFSMVDSTIKMMPEGEAVATESSADGTIHGWKFENINPGETVNISYSIVQDDPNASTKKLYTVYKG